jgi:hypothetical protein
MSSLSQEDLDAGWDDEPEQSAAAKAESANGVSQSIAPPNSITIEKTPAPLESVIVRSAPPDNTECADPNTADASPLSVPDTTHTESTDVNSPATEDHERVGRVPDEKQVAESSSTAPGEHSLEFEGQSGESNLAVRVTQAESSSEAVTQGADSSPEAMAPGVESRQQATEPLDPTSQATSPATVASSDLVASEASSTGAPSASGLDVQLDLFTAVAEKPQLLSQKGVNTGAEADPVEPESASGEVEAKVQSKPMQAPSALPEREAPAVAYAPAGNKASVKPLQSVDLGGDEPAAVALAPRAKAESYAIQHWRSIAIAATAALFLAAVLFAIRSKHAQTKQDKPAVLMVETHSEHVAPVVISNPPNTASEAARMAKPAASAEIGAPEPVRSPPAAAESFSDAFVKHAATFNSSWAEVKKRPKAIESNQLNKPVAAGSAKANDNPLDVLDKLEKARKAKKTTGK